ncbi:hypothetical protein CORC01_08947 [Colletotrichum orchidophilum]|uniref:Uncharacterized protein n=1 Tax=Colletotrichum orchidophilum TaxID=1209926 RepID=A0A1G4B371_9PEZI|nr:uncharacterized protein CORC01_08947 [Colletotrichum orchidophilum]OHE95806.1 hypothetical protein CORC01_08947 [Colletotrichum orchidophilum]
MTRKNKAAASKAREKAAQEDGARGGAKLQDVEKMMTELNINKGEDGHGGEAHLHGIEELMIELNIKKEDIDNNNHNGHDQNFDCGELKQEVTDLKSTKNPKNGLNLKTKKANNENSAPKAQKKLTKKEEEATLFERWDEYFGKRELADWQRLCGDLGLPKDLPSKTQCRQALKTVHVNIRQFLRAESRHNEVLFFKNIFQLAQYTRKNRMWMPKKGLPKGDPLLTLRRKIGQYL